MNPRLGDLTEAQVAERLAGDRGLVLDLGAMRVAVRSPLTELAAALGRLYAELPQVDERDFVDTAVSVRPASTARRWFRPKVLFDADGIVPFDPAPRDFALPMLEWGLNWCFATFFNRHLLLHSGSVEIGGVGVLMVGQTGSGKSTLTAALSLRGARLLSDEFGIVRVADSRILPLPKPAALKNESIELLRRWEPAASIGAAYRKTRKGDVAHLAVSRPAAERRAQAVAPGVIVFPRWAHGAEFAVEPVAPGRAFGELALNSFNYGLLGPIGFDAVGRLVEQSACYRLEYARLEDAVPAVFELAERSSRLRGWR